MNLRLRIYPPPSDNVGGGIDVVLSGSYDVPELTFDSPPMILDIGAHVGSFSVWAAARWPGAKILAIEPHPVTAAYCRANTEGLVYELIERAVIGERAGEADTAFLYDGKHNTGQRSLFMLGEQLETGSQVRTMRARDLPRADILKIDTEGCELEILRDYRFLSEVHALMVEWHSRSDYETLLLELPPLGFQLVRDDAKGAFLSDRNLIFLQNQSRTELPDSARETPHTLWQPGKDLA